MDTALSSTLFAFVAADNIELRIVGATRCDFTLACNAPPPPIDKVPVYDVRRRTMMSKARHGQYHRVNHPTTNHR